MPVIDNSRERIDFAKEDALRRFFSNLPADLPELEELQVAPHNQLNDPLVDEKTAANTLACSVALMRKWRRLGGGPRVVRISRLVRYQQSDLVAFIQAKKERVV